MNGLKSTNAIDGKVWIRIREFLNGELRSEYVATYEDTDDDYGDAYDEAERAILAAGDCVTRGSSLKTVSTESRCMLTATRFHD